MIEKLTCTTLGHTLLDIPEVFPRLPALAERLNIKPNTREGEAGRTLLIMKNGDKYDLFDLVNAFLDRADAALPHSP